MYLVLRTCKKKTGRLEKVHCEGAGYEIRGWTEAEALREEMANMFPSHEYRIFYEVK